MSNKNLKKQEASEKLKYDSYRFMHFVAIKINFLLHFLVKKRLHVSLMFYKHSPRDKRCASLLLYNSLQVQLLETRL